MIVEFFFSPEVQRLMQSYGLPVLCGTILFESVGIPFPAETALVTAAISAGVSHQMNIITIIIAASISAFIGYILGYAIGRFMGIKLIARYGHYLHISKSRLQVGEYLFVRHGGKIVFFGRFIPFIRALAALSAGSNRMPWQRFVIVNLLGAVGWASAIGGGAYLLGTSIKLIVGPVGLVLLTAAAGLLVAGMVYFRRHEQELEKRAAAALPQSATLADREDSGQPVARRIG